MITGLSFGHGYYKIKCENYEQANKLMAEMKASLKNIDFVSGSKNNEVMVNKAMQRYEADKMFRCLKEVASTNPNTASEAINNYKKFPKKPPKPKIDVTL